MKKIIFILALFVSFVANAQYTPPPGYTNINSRYDWLAGVFRALGIPAGGSAAFTTGQSHRAGAIYYDSTGVDSGLYVWSGLAWRNYDPSTLTASQGITKVGSDFRLGQTIGQSGNPAALSVAREVPLNGNYLSFLGSTGGYVQATDSGSLKLFSFNDQPYEITQRKVGLSFPVSTIRPVGNNQQMAFDIMPKGVPTPDANGFAWMDVCDTDVYGNENPVNAARVGITTTAAQFGSVAFNGATVKPVEYLVGGVKKMEMLTDATSTINIFSRRFVQDQSASGDYIGYHLFNSNNSVASSDAIFFIGNDFATNRFGFLRWSNGATVPGSETYRQPNQLEILSNIGATNGMVLGSLGTGPVKFIQGSSSAEFMRIEGGQLGIGTITPDASSVVDITSTTKGILPPRMTAAQRTAIGSPGPSLFLWDNDSTRYMGYNGSAWKGIAWTGEGGGTPTLQQVLTAGSTLTGNNTIANDHVLSITGNSAVAFGDLFSVTNTSTTGRAINAASAGTNSTIQAINTKTTAGGGGALWVVASGSNAAASINRDSSSTATVVKSIDINRTTSGTAADGIGGAIHFNVESQSGSGFFTNSVESIWKNSIDANRESMVRIRGVDNAVEEIFMDVEKDGVVIVNNGADTLATKAYARSVGGGGGSGDVVGPASATDGVPALFDGTTGKLLKNSTPTGTGNPVMQTTPTFTTNITTPSIIGGTGTTQSLIYKTTTGVGATGADHIFQVGNNGATEAMRILNSGSVGIGVAAPNSKLSVNGRASFYKGTEFVYADPTSTDFIVSNSAANSRFLFGQTISSYGGLNWIYNATAANAYMTVKMVNTDVMSFLQNGNVGVGTTAPTAFLHLKAGTATASTAPLKLTAGTNLTTPEAGAVEFDGANYFATASTTRYTLAKTLTATAALDFASTGSGAVADLTITVTGAADGDAVTLGVPNGSVTATATYSAWVSAANTVTVRFSPKATEDPASGTFRVSVIKY